MTKSLNHHSFYHLHYYRFISHNYSKNYRVKSVNELKMYKGKLELKMNSFISYLSAPGKQQRQTHALKCHHQSLWQSQNHWSLLPLMNLWVYLQVLNHDEFDFYLNVNTSSLIKFIKLFWTELILVYKRHQSHFWFCSWNLLAALDSHSPCTQEASTPYLLRSNIRSTKPVVNRHSFEFILARYTANDVFLDHKY
jgi:hypothetical protein